MTETINGANVKFYCKHTSTYTDKAFVKSFRCEQNESKGIWLADQPGNWKGCLGISIFHDFINSF